MNAETTVGTTSTAESVAERVREHYARAITQVTSGRGACGCSTGVASGLYDQGERDALPEDAVNASMGCGNPTALIELREGETVLDLGSGGGIDVLLSARRVGERGFAYGLDMTEEMLSLALANKAKAEAPNVAFLKGHMEDIPLPASSVDVVISNCVINLSGDKDRVLHEAFRVLRPGGRFAVADIVATGSIADALRRDPEAWAGCLAGAVEVETYRGQLSNAGFEDISIEILRDVLPANELAVSAFVRATKPVDLPLRA
jgi:arsenite methyltransferase